MKLVLTIQMKSDAPTLIFDVNRINHLVFGRSTKDSSWIPNVDLTKFGAHKLGVSRRHAAINKLDSGLHILDLGSANGTFVNERKLVPNQAHPIQHGDTIRIGYLSLGVQLDQ